jgi:hypothetical protein
MEYEIDQIIYPNREKQMVREKCFSYFADSQRLRLLRSEIPAAIRPMIKKVTK